MTLAGKLVLVTGGTGFVGGRLVERLILEQQARVRVLVRNYANAPLLARFPLEMISGDMNDRDAVERAVQGCEVVFHCAHEGRLGKGEQEEQTTRGIRNLSEAVLKWGVPRLVHVSTFAVYGPTPDGELTETSPWQPSPHPYIRAKRAAERFVLDWYREKQLPVVVLQPTIVYGAYCKPWTYKPVEDLKTGLVPLVNGGHGYCNAVYIDDVVDAMVLAAERPDVLGEVYLISGAKPVTWREFYGAFENALGTRATIEISEDELRAIQAEARRQKTFRAQVMKLAKDRRVIAKVRDLPPVRAVVNFAMKYLPAAQKQALGAYLWPGAAAKNQPVEPVRPPVHVPNDTLLALYRAKTDVSIDKARKSLGYTPRFDLERGMALTSQFIRWANLSLGRSS